MREIIKCFISIHRELKYIQIPQSGDHFQNYEDMIMDRITGVSSEPVFTVIMIELKTLPKFLFAFW